MALLRTSSHGFHTVWTKFMVENDKYSCTLCSHVYKINTSSHPSSTLAMRHLRDRHADVYEEVVKAERQRKIIIKARNMPKKGGVQEYLSTSADLLELLNDDNDATLKSIVSVASTSQNVNFPHESLSKSIMAQCEKTGCFVQLGLNQDGSISMSMIKDHDEEAKGLKMRQGKARHYLVVLPNSNGNICPAGGFDLYFDFKIHYQQNTDKSSLSDLSTLLNMKLPKEDELLQKYLLSQHELKIMKERCLAARKAEAQAKKDLISLRQTLDEYKEKIRQFEYRLENTNDYAYDIPFTKDRYPTLIKALETRLEEQKLKNSILEAKRQLENFSNSYQIKYPEESSDSIRNLDEEGLSKSKKPKITANKSSGSKVSIENIQKGQNSKPNNEYKQPKTIQLSKQTKEDGSVRRVYRVVYNKEIKTEPEDMTEKKGSNRSHPKELNIKQEIDF